MCKGYLSKPRAWMVGSPSSASALAVNAKSYVPGPNGVNTMIGVSGFVGAQTSAMSFDRDLVEAQHAAMAAEFKAKGYGGNLGPVTGPLGRSVKNGRLFEGFGSDPY